MASGLVRRRVELATHGLVGRRVRLDIDEPSEFAARHDNVREGTVVRVLVFPTPGGRSYEIAIVRMDRVLEYGNVRISTGRYDHGMSSVVSIMPRHEGEELNDLLQGRWISVNVALEDVGCVSWAPDNPKWDDVARGFDLGYGVVRLV